MEFIYCASEGPFGPQQVRHRARAIENSDGRYITACGKESGGPGNMHPDWDDWGVGGPFDGDEWPPITCARCPQPIRPCADAQAALRRVEALADQHHDCCGYVTTEAVRAVLAALRGAQ